MTRIEPQDGAEPRRWVYIAGEPRSGTTLLGVLIAASIGAFNCGELRLLWIQLDAGGLCQCGSELGSCEVWSAVVADVRRTLGAHFDEAVGRNQSPRWSLDKFRFPRADPATEALRTATEQALERVTGEHVFVDASKFAGTLISALGRDRPLVVPHLVRDPRGVTFSWRRAKTLPATNGTLPPRPAWTKALLWSRNNQVIDRLLRDAAQADRPVASVRIRYEDLTADPAPLLEAIAQAAGVPLVSRPPAGGHGIAGNTVLYEPAPVTADDRWTREMRWRDKAVASALTAPLLRRYGYPLWPPAAAAVPSRDGSE